MSITLAQIQSASNEQLLAMVKRRHPEYTASVKHWEFLELSYKGGREWIDANLFTYHKEGKTEFRKRKERAYRFAHSREVISLINKYVFKGTIERRPEEDLPAEIQDFWKSSTLLKRPIADLMNSVSTWTSTFGRIWVVVDNNIPADAVSVADVKDAKGRCYAYHLKPVDVLDLAYDDDGELLWLLNREYYRDDQDPLSAGGLSSRFRLWTKDFSIPITVTKNKSTEKAELGTPTVYSLGVVPIFPADHLDSEEAYKSNGLIDEVAYLDRTVANYLSNLDVIIQDQTFSQLAIPFQGLLPSENSGSVEDEGEDADEQRHIQQMGHNRVFAYNAEGGAAPTFLSPDVKQADIIMKAISKIIGEIYHSIGMAGERTKEDNAAGIDNSSGVAKAYDFEKLNAMLAAKARSLQHIEKNLIRLVKAWNSDLVELQDIEDYVSYPTTFDVRNLSDEFDNAQRLSLVGASKELRRAQMKRLAEKMFPQMPEAELKKILDEIKDDWLEEAEIDALGAAGGAPALGKGRVEAGPKKNKQGENNKDTEKTV